MKDKIKCNYFQKELSAYIDNEIDFITSWKIKRHLKMCSECQKELQKLEKLHKISKLVLVKHPKYDLYEKIQKKLPRIKTSPHRKSSILREIWTSLPQPGRVALLAGAALLLFFSLIYPQFFSKSLSINQFEEEYVRSQEILPWAEGPVLPVTLISDERG